jgi:hypothetical protein
MRRGSARSETRYRWVSSTSRFGVESVCANSTSSDSNPVVRIPTEFSPEVRVRIVHVSGTTDEQHDDHSSIEPVSIGHRRSRTSSLAHDDSNRHWLHSSASRHDWFHLDSTVRCNVPRRGLDDLLGIVSIHVSSKFATSHGIVSVVVATRRPMGRTDPNENRDSDGFTRFDGRALFAGTRPSSNRCVSDMDVLRLTALERRFDRRLSRATRRR